MRDQYRGPFVLAGGLALAARQSPPSKRETPTNTTIHIDDILSSITKVKNIDELKKYIEKNTDDRTLYYAWNICKGKRKLLEYLASKPQFRLDKVEYRSTSQTTHLFESNLNPGLGKLAESINAFDPDTSRLEEALALVKEHPELMDALNNVLRNPNPVLQKYADYKEFKKSDDQKLAEIRRELRDAIEDVERLYSVLAEEKRKKAKLQKELEKCDEEATYFENIAETQELEIIELQRVRQSLTEQLGQSEQKINELTTKLSEEIATHTESIKLLQERMQEIQTANEEEMKKVEDELFEANSQIAELFADVTKSKKELDDCQEEKEELNTELVKLEAARQEEKEHLNTELVKLGARHSKLKEEKEKEKEAHEEEKEELNTELIKLRTELQRLNEKFIRLEEEKTQLDTDFQQKTRELAQGELAAQESGMKIFELNKLLAERDQKLSAWEARERSLNEELNALTSKHSVLKGEHSILNDNLTKLKSEHLSETSALSKTIEESLTKIRTLEERNVELDKIVSDLQAKNNSLKARNTQSEQTMNEYKERLKALSGLSKKLETDNVNIKEEVGRLEADNVNVKKEVGRLEAAIKDEKLQSVIQRNKRLIDNTGGKSQLEQLSKWPGETTPEFKGSNGYAPLKFLSMNSQQVVCIVEVQECAESLITILKRSTETSFRGSQIFECSNSYYSSLQHLFSYRGGSNLRRQVAAGSRN